MNFYQIKGCVSTVADQENFVEFDAKLEFSDKLMDRLISNRFTNF
jgi:hypothetical protein